MGKKTIKPKKYNKTKNKKRKPKKHVNKYVKLKKVKKDKKKYEEKKVAVPYKKLIKIIDDDIIKKTSLKDLKIFASNFDINPKVNFKLLSILKKESKSEYNKYIDKYKYTLDYNDAKKLKCFSNIENEIIKDLNTDFKYKIKEIKSLSKIKLFSFLFYINNLKCNFSYIEDDLYRDSLEKIKEKIISYSSEKNLIFKIPNNYGNYELQYYSYLNLFVNYFLDKLETKNKIKNKDSDESLFFDWDKKTYGIKEKIDITEFEKDKNKLKKFIKENIAKNKNNEKSTQMMKVENTNDNNNKKDKDNIKNNELEVQEDPKMILSNFFDRHIKKLKKFEKEIIFLFKEESDDEKILKQIEFIYYNLLFTKEGSKLYESYPNCLQNNPLIKNEQHKNQYNMFAINNIEEFIKKDELVFYNLDSYFMATKDNPFSNRAKYYSYPILLKKNIFQANEKTFNSFRRYLKEIYKSKLLEEIFYLTTEFNDFKYPLLDDEILDEMIDNTIFLPYDQEALHGYTQKQFAKIFISSNLFKDSLSQKDISKIVVDISLVFNTLIHEQLKHYIKGLLYYNAFRFRQKKRLDSDLADYESDRFFIDNLQIIFSEKKNIILRPVIDGGNRAEIYLYGKILYKLFFNEALEMHDKSTWNLSVLEHLKQFKKNNKFISKEKEVKLDDIIKSKTMSEFIKDIIIQFNQLYKCNDIILFNYGVSGSCKNANEDLDYIGNDVIVFDYGDYLENTIINVPDTETNKKILHLFEQ